MGKTGSKHTDNTDRQFVKQVIEGDSGAYAPLIDKYRGPLRNYIETFISDRFDAEDVCQRTFIKAFTKINTYNPEYEFSTWLYAIAQNEMKDMNRKSRTSINSVPINERNESLALDYEGSPEEKMIAGQTERSLMEGIGNLTDEYKKIAEMRLIKEYAYEEISKELGIPLGTVKARLFRAKKILRTYIESKNGTAD